MLAVMGFDLILVFIYCLELNTEKPKTRKYSLYKRQNQKRQPTILNKHHQSKYNHIYSSRLLQWQTMYNVCSALSGNLRDSGSDLFKVGVPKPSADSGIN